jgi:Divergent InlB B-repeat domain
MSRKVGILATLVSTAACAIAALAFSGSAEPRPTRGDATSAQVTLLVAAMPDGAVKLEPAGTEAGSGTPIERCQHDYPDGECRVQYSAPVNVKLTAEPGPGQTFRRWSTPECGSGPTCVLQLADGVEPPQVWAVFDPASLTVLIAGDGTVTGANGGIACDSSEAEPDCSESLPAGSPLTLTAAPKTPGAAVRWVFGCDPGDNPNVTTCVAHPENRYVGVSFGNTPGPGPPFDVDVKFRVKTIGSGRVTGESIDCGSTCATTVDFGARMKLSTAADAGSRFDHWEGAPCSTQEVCVLNAGPVTAVRAVFAAKPAVTPAPAPAPAPAPPPTTTSTPTTSTPAPGRPSVTPARLSVRFLGASSRRVKGRYRVFARVDVSTNAEARLAVLRGKRLLGGRLVRMRKGRTVAWVALNPATRAGTCQVRLRVRDGSGQLVVVQRRIVLGR